MTVVRYLKGSLPSGDSESAEQQALVRWAALNENRYPGLEMLYAIPNGGHRHVATAVRLKAEGVKAGVPDLCLPVARCGYHGLYIEMKSEKGKLTQLQKRWIEKLNEQTHLAVVCKGFEEARDVIVDYLQGKLSPWQTA